MWIGILLLLFPAALYAVSLLWLHRLTGKLRLMYLTLGAIIVFGGSFVSFYFAMYTGDQGGIAAFLFQLFVITTYLIFVVAVVLFQAIKNRRD